MRTINTITDSQFRTYLLRFMFYNLRFTITIYDLQFCFFYQFQSSSCLSDKDEDDIYDFAAKYEGAGKHHIFWNGNKPRVSPG